MIVVFTLENCPNCERLKAWLKKNNKPFLEQDLSDTRAAEIITMRMKGVFPNEAPAMRIGSLYFLSQYIFDAHGISEMVQKLVGDE